MRITGLLAAFALLFVTSAALASEGIELPGRKWSWEGPFGSFDRGELQRGLQVYKEVCSACHSLNFVAFRNLSALGYDEDAIKAFAAEYEVEDGPNDDGEMFMRPAIPSDYFVPPFPNEQAARAANAGAYPPDLSLITKARKNGPNYLFAILTGYEDEVPEDLELPEKFELGEGMNFNRYFAGHQIAMPPPLSEDGVEYVDGTKATVEQQATDVTAFLTWAAEPALEQRKSLGIKVIVFLIIFTAMLYAVKRKVWSDVEH